MPDKDRLGAFRCQKSEDLQLHGKICGKQQPIIINSAHYEKALWIQAAHLPRLPSSDWAACLRPEPLSSMHLAQPLLPAKEVEVPLRGRFSL